MTTRTRKTKPAASKVRPRRKQTVVDSDMGGVSAYDWLMSGTDREFEEEHRARMDAEADFLSAYDPQRSFSFQGSAPAYQWPRRNSETDPYKVDFLPAEVMGSSNRIGLGMHPGRGDRGTRIDWDRNLEADLEAMWKAGVRTVVCMVEEHEFNMLRVPRYIRDVEDFGIDVIWFPVRDVSTPVSFRLMHKVCFQVWEALKTGNVLVHCRGGKGRSGTLACCYLEMMGYSYRQALNIVRSVRKGTVETRQQESWCEEFERYMNGVRREAAREAEEQVGDDA